MGDKSQKAKDRHKKQDDAEKNQKRLAAIAKATPPQLAPRKQGR